MYYVYVIQNESSKIYIGQTNNLNQRLARHNGVLASKATNYTRKNTGKWQIVYKEEVLSRQEALHREKYLKSHVGRDWLRKYLRARSSTAEQ